MDQRQANDLIEKFLNGTATPYERSLVENWYNSRSEREPMPDAGSFDHVGEQVWDDIRARTGVLFPQKKVAWRRRIAVAACIAAGLSVVGYLWLAKKPAQQLVKVKAPVEHKVLPGGNRAILTLSNGKQIDLSSAEKGLLADVNYTKINKTADGQVAYSGADEKTTSSTVTYNTMTTPRGGQYSLILTDGTKVVLNAASSLRFPTSFPGHERSVELNGEAYFEVAHNAAKPFKVMSRGQVIEVKGTHFNVDSYNDDDEIRTTLLEGAVTVTKGSNQVLLKPGQQSQVSSNDGNDAIKVVAVRLEETIAWKNGLFEFNRATIQDVMRSAARWYDLNVTYSEKIPDIKISGRISRKVSLSGLIDLLEFEGVRFSINGNNIKILN